MDNNRFTLDFSVRSPDTGWHGFTIGFGCEFNMKYFIDIQNEIHGECFQVNFIEGDVK